MSVAPLCSWGAPEGQRGKAFAPSKAVLQPAAPLCDCWLGAGALQSAVLLCPGGALAEVPGVGMLCAGSAPLSLAAVNTARGSQLWTAGPVAHLLLGGREEQGPPASALQRAWSCCIQHKALILLCCQYTFIGKDRSSGAVSAALERMHAWSCPSLPTWMQQAGAAVGLLEPEKGSRLLIFALGLRQLPFPALLVSWLCSALSRVFWDSSVFQPWVQEDCWGKPSHCSC